METTFRFQYEKNSRKFDIGEVSCVYACVYVCECVHMRVLVCMHLYSFELNLKSHAWSMRVLTAAKINE